MINSTLFNRGRSKWLEQQLDDNHKGLCEPLKMNLPDMFTTSTEQHQRSSKHSGLWWVTSFKSGKKKSFFSWTFSCLLTLKAQLVFSESTRINQHSKEIIILKTYGVSPKNPSCVHHYYIMDRSSQCHLLITFLQGQTQMHFLSPFLFTRIIKETI